MKLSKVEIQMTHPCTPPREGKKESPLACPELFGERGGFVPIFGTKTGCVITN